MIELLLLVIIGIITFRSIDRSFEDDDLPTMISERIGKLWDVAHQGMKEQRFLRAEKALLTILKIDQKNAPAYNRLGILYAKQKEYKNAIDCFEVASSIDPSASSLHNLGLIYFETENYQKAATAFEQALKLEDSLAARHIAYAKVQEKLGNTKVMIQELRLAAELEPSYESLTLLKQAYETLGEQAQADLTAEQIKKYSKTSKKQITKKRITRPKRRVVI
jgi:tetratricopeptide (TPR) repeat protein